MHRPPTVSEFLINALINIDCPGNEMIDTLDLFNELVVKDPDLVTQSFNEVTLRMKFVILVVCVLLTWKASHADSTEFDPEILRMVALNEPQLFVDDYLIENR